LHILKVYALTPQFMQLQMATESVFVKSVWFDTVNKRGVECKPLSKWQARRISRQNSQAITHEVINRNDDQEVAVRGCCCPFLTRQSKKKHERTPLLLKEEQQAPSGSSLSGHGLD
jgi:hypothetical protein